MNVEALRDYWEQTARGPMILGKLDCVSFVIDSLRIGFDRDYSDALVYTSRRTAIETLRARGGLKQAVTDVLGDPVPVDDLDVGDVAWLDDPETIGIVMREYIAVKGNKCVHRVALDSALEGWRTDGG